MPDSLETVASRIARLAMVNVPNLGKVGGGSPVVSVVRDTETFDIFVALNTNAPPNMADVLQHSIDAQQERIANGHVQVVHTEAAAQEGGHSEVCALNAAIRAREARMKRKLTETELRVFELHNVWLKGDRAGTTAPRCEHCARITRSVAVTQSMFVAEGGVVGETTVRPVPVRGMIKRAGAVEPEEADSAHGTITPRRAGGLKGGAGGDAFLAEGILSTALVAAVHMVGSWVFRRMLKDKFETEARDKIWAAINAHHDKFKVLIESRRPDILWSKADNRPVSLHVCVETVWQATELGNALMRAEVSYYDLLFEGETHIEWPIFQNRMGLLTQTTNDRECFNFAL